MESEFAMCFEELGMPLALAGLVSSVLLIAAFALALLRIVKGPTAFDRVVALDLIGGICLCIIVMFAIQFEQPVLLDAAFAIAIVSFIGTVAFARYLGKGGEQ
ncbi:monovalent cation/H+ antiporter complex subunit F [Coraliomargarita sp. SDUM461003]|uniref:Monovalent cation/H+ antiporter complex subunit F n=1 Tax=Thalassobacterium maritimum TaxID=3041265 RepID=A0ABU1B0E7_9BACT|nr:monovalent cation/H+ antiporter complex subunit F [Coraliomargarita sp. SDUM461003]MDQ8208850.1 monovalent cation/H+ antiporter complex subunit F [Coraliomargarita sp. SDUM461003]